MILSAYERKDSPFVWIQFVDASGRKRYEKTTVRKDDPEKARRVAKALNRIEARLLAGEDSEARTPARRAESWMWVASYLRQRYAARKPTLRVYLIQWDQLAAFLAEREIDSPAMLTRADCFDFIPWRQAQRKEKSGRAPKLNTALGELKLLGLVMREAIARGLAVDNPASKLGIEREDSPEKPAMTDAEIAQIYAALEQEPQWMRRSFHIGLHTGLRFSETQIHRGAVNLERRVIDIARPKGGKRRAFSIPLYASIEPMIREFLASRQEWLWMLPPQERDLTGLAWMRFFRRIGLPHLCFHCTRTTFITRGALGDPSRGAPPIPESVMMRLVNHGRAEIHRIYQRFSGADLAAFGATIQIPMGSAPPAAGATAQSRRRKGGAPSSACPPSEKSAPGNTGCQ